MMDSKIGRRSLLKRVFLFLAFGPGISGSFRRAMGQAALPEVKKDDPVAKSLSYCSDAAKSSKTVCPARADKAKAEQFCRKCQFYTKQSGEGAAELGKCQILPTGLVRGAGWCQSFVQKQG